VTLLEPDITWHVYECPPIDFWNGAVGVEEYVVLLGERGIDVEEVDELVSLFESAVNALVKLTTWEGDGRWWLSALPDVESRMMWVMFLVKQQSNGTTFIASMVELPWLSQWRCDRPRPISAVGSWGAAHVERVRALAAEVLERRAVTN
jgi:hypothetical protein